MRTNAVLETDFLEMDSIPSSSNLVIYYYTSIYVRRDSIVGIATRHGLGGPGIESGWGRDFPHPSRPTLGPVQPPVQWVPGHSRGSQLVEALRY